ncbi:MAG TPA: DHA2 family efflux MFS transporter permease subunit [Rhizomicrobium sp.]|nr:DHA2 family efflux MFS transporter permease subunit [Rhizomicrobium sp.]
MAGPNAPASYDGPPPLHGPALVAGVMVLAMANFMAVLDMTIVNISIPHIAGSLAISPTEGTWAITSYAVAEAIMVPLTGWLASRFGPVRVFITAAGGFGVFSLLCGLSQSLPMLIFTRVMQGVMGGPLMPMSQTLLMRIAPPERRNMALGIWTMTTILGPIAGPLVAGTLADSWGWPWSFFINVPVAVLCVMLASSILTKFETKTVKKPIDFVGLALMVTFIGALQIMMDNGENDDWFSSNFIISLALVAGVFFLAFLAWELTDEHPIVNLKVFRHRGFAVSALAMLFTFGSFMGSIVLIPLWLQLTMNYTAFDAGQIMAMNGMISIFVAPTAAMLLNKIDARYMMSFGLLVVAADMFWRTTFNTDITFWQLAPAQMALGVGMPLFFVPLMSLAMSSVQPTETADAAGLISFLRTMSGAFSTAIITFSWRERTVHDRVELVNGLGPTDHSMSMLRHAGQSAGQALLSLSNLVDTQATMLATNNIFFSVSLVLLGVAAGVWLMPKPKLFAKAGPGGH